MSGNIVIAQAVHAWVDEALTDDRYRIDQQKLGTLGRAGGPHYVTTRGLFSFGRGSGALTQALPAELAPESDEP